LEFTSYFHKKGAHFVFAVTVVTLSPEFIVSVFYECVIVCTEKKGAKVLMLGEFLAQSVLHCWNSEFEPIFVYA